MSEIERLERKVRQRAHRQFPFLLWFLVVALTAVLIYK